MLFGTLGKKWKQWEKSNYEPCRCFSGDKCLVYHGKFADVEIYGECVICDKEVIERQLDIGKKHSLEGNLVRSFLSCGHPPAGLTRIWAHVFETGYLEFEVKVECYNSRCKAPTKASISKLEHNIERGIIRDIKAVPCCSKPQISLISACARFVSSPLTTQTKEDNTPISGHKRKHEESESTQEYKEYKEYKEEKRKEARPRFAKTKPELQPPNWPSDVKYLPHAVWSEEAMPHINKVISRERKIISKVEIKDIDDQKHPVFGKKGLFAAKGASIKKDEVLGPYTGFVTKKKYSESEYIVPLHEENDLNLDIDAKFGGNEFRFVNDYSGIHDSPNVKLVPSVSNNSGFKYVAVKAERDITDGEELVMSYGKQYWDNIK